jgi:integrase
MARLDRPEVQHQGFANVAGVYKRACDKKRGKAGKWTITWVGVDGKRHTQSAFTDKGKSFTLAIQKETEAKLIREGLLAPGEAQHREAANRPLADHIEDYRRSQLAKSDTVSHAKRTAHALTRLFELAEVTSINGIAPDRIQIALGRLREKFSPRTANFSLGAVRASARWAEDSERIAKAPKGLKSIRKFNEEVGRSKSRRAMTLAELARLFGAARSSDPIVTARVPRTGNRLPTATLTGPEREAVHRLAAGTGFRAEEIRSLTREAFRLTGDEPSVKLSAEAAKNGRERIQPIRRDLAVILSPFVAKTPRGGPVFRLPAKTADMLRRDLERAGIAVKTSEGELDFHALRGTFITTLIESGANPKVVQELARHASISTTMAFYAKAPQKTMRDALEGEGSR